MEDKGFKMAHHFLSLPHEVLHGILVRVNPPDIASLCRSCSTLNSYVKNNRLLFKELYLAHFVSGFVPSLIEGRGDF